MVTSNRAERAWARLREVEASAEFRETLAKELPYRAVALALVDLRARHGLTQRQLADLIESTQPVIARAESGQHPIEVRLLSRIAEAVSEPLVVAFGNSTLSAGDQSAARPDQPSELESSGDELLDAFNAANTAADFSSSHRVAERIAAEPSTPRRKVALALDAYNRREYAEARRWSDEALVGDLPITSRETAILVQARALINLGESRRAVRGLRSLRGEPQLGWLVPAALADAYSELDQERAAVREARRAFDMAPHVPEVRYLMARITWHAGHAWEALEHVALFRAAKPSSAEGLLLHGSILGFLASEQSDAGAYESALALFRQALPSGDCEAYRLCALTAGFLGRWEEAFKWAVKLLTHPGRADRSRCHHQSDDDHRDQVMSLILPATFEAIGQDDPEKMATAANTAERLFGTSPVITHERALSRALSGDVRGTLLAVGRTMTDLSAASADDQLAVAAAYYFCHDMRNAFAIMRRVEDHLANPLGLLRYAEAALGAGELVEARRILRKISEGDEIGAETARLAMALMRASEQTSARSDATLRDLDVRWPTFGTMPESETTRHSPWEGLHYPTSPLIDAILRPKLN